MTNIKTVLEFAAMATVTTAILRHHKKKDGTWNVKIRVTLKRKSSYIDTQHFINETQIRRDFTIKDQFILGLLAPVLNDFRRKISELEGRLDLFTVKELTEYLMQGDLVPEKIDVVRFGEDRLVYLEKVGRLASRNDLRKVINSLKDYFGKEFIAITEIRSNMLRNYESFLRTPRKMKRKDQFGRLLERESKGLSDLSVHNHMRDLRILFNELVRHYNDGETGSTIIRHYPFEKYKIPSPPESNKRKLSISQIKKIRDLDVPKNSRIELSRDLFMLSFYMCGMNPIDIYKLQKFVKIPKRIEYNRSKTEGRRKDKAFISIAVPDVCQEILLKYNGELRERYATSQSLGWALSCGMRKIGQILDIDKLQFYDARHAFASFARNKCGFTKDDVALALNHKDNSCSITDVYIGRDWNIIDKLQRAVLSLIEPPAKTGNCNVSSFAWRKIERVLP